MEQSPSMLNRVGNTAKDGAKNAATYVAIGACVAIGAGLVAFGMKKLMPKTWNSLKQDAKEPEPKA